MTCSSIAVTEGKSSIVGVRSCICGVKRVSLLTRLRRQTSSSAPRSFQAVRKMLRPPVVRRHHTLVSDLRLQGKGLLRCQVFIFSFSPKFIVRKANLPDFSLTKQEQMQSEVKLLLML